VLACTMFGAKFSIELTLSASIEVVISSVGCCYLADSQERK
jgi:hypothetical protein